MMSEKFADIRLNHNILSVICYQVNLLLYLRLNIDFYRFVFGIERCFRILTADIVSFISLHLAFGQPLLPFDWVFQCHL